MGQTGVAPRWNMARAAEAFFRPGNWFLARFLLLDRSARPILWVIGIFLVQAIPATIIRASNLEEGRILAMARGALEDGHWIAPFIYGERFVERPVLASWIAAVFGSVTGEVTLWSLRIPHLAFFLVGALLIFGLLRQNAVSKSGAIFGALCWICMPVVAPKFINAEADIVLSTLLFCAFFWWWRATITNRITLWTWLIVGVLLALAGLTKGPQPIAYFTLGVGAYMMLKQREQLVGFVAANAMAVLVIGSWYGIVHQPGDTDLWRAHSRLADNTTLAERMRDHLDFVKSLIIEFLPGTILLGPAIAIAFRNWKTDGHDLLLAAVLYSIACTLVLIFWPGGVAARYAMPATMSLAVICGLMFDRYRSSHPRVIVSALFVGYLIFGGLFLRGWVVMPFWPHLFKESEIVGAAISAALEKNSGPLYVIDSTTDYNMLIYVRAPIRAVSIGEIAKLEVTSIAMMLPEDEEWLAARRPDLVLSRLSDIASRRRPYRVVEVRPGARKPECNPAPCDVEAGPAGVGG